MKEAKKQREFKSLEDLVALIKEEFSEDGFPVMNIEAINLKDVVGSIFKIKIAILHSAIKNIIQFAEGTDVNVEHPGNGHRIESVSKPVFGTLSLCYPTESPWNGPYSPDLDIDDYYFESITVVFHDKVLFKSCGSDDENTLLDKRIMRITPVILKTAELIQKFQDERSQIKKTEPSELDKVLSRID